MGKMPFCENCDAELVEEGAFDSKTEVVKTAIIEWLKDREHKLKYREMQKVK